MDVLSRGRLHVGLSAGAPPFGALLGERLFDGDAGSIDFSHARVERLRRNLQGDLLGDEETFVESPAGRQRPRLQPHAPGLAQRLWYGGGSLRSAQWAGEQGYHLLIGNINRGEQTDHFFEAQRAQLALFHARWAAHQPPGSLPRVALGRVIVPLDGADASTRARYLAWAATRQARTLAPQGERRTLFARDLVGHSEQILQWLREDPIVPLVQELPYDFAPEEYRQILEDTAQRIAPELGWRAGAVQATTAAAGEAWAA